MKFSVKIFKSFVLLFLFTLSNKVHAVPFRELNRDLVQNCIGCKYYSILYDAISQGGYRIYTGLFDICMFFLAVSLSFQLLSKLFKIVVTDAMQMDPHPVSNLDLFWKDIFKKMIRIVFITTLVFTLEPKNIIKWTIDPIVSGGISVAREFINYGIKQINTNIVDNKDMIQTIQPENFIPKINLGIIKLPINVIDKKLEQSQYCITNFQIEMDAKKYEEMDTKQNLIHSLPIQTKLDLMCLIRDIGILSKRYAGLATYYMLYIFNKNKIDQVPKNDKNADKIVLNISTSKSSNIFDTTFNEENNVIDNILTVLFVIWLCGIGITIFNLVKWFIPDPLIAFIVAIFIPCILLILYSIFGGAVIFMTIAYYVLYLLFILLIPFYFIQPMFAVSIILFAFPIIAMTWAIGDRSYTEKAINTIVGSSIGIAVLCMVFVVAVMLNEVTFYTLYNGTISNISNNNSDITSRLQMFNFLIMALTNLLSIYLISNHSKIAKLFGGSTDNDIFSFFKSFITSNFKKIVDVTSLFVKQKDKNE